MRKVIISVAAVAGPDPVNPTELANDVTLAVAKGASLCHLHCKTREGKLTPNTDVLIESFEKITAGTDVVVQASTGGISDMSIQERCNPLDYWRVESASLNGVLRISERLFTIILLTIFDIAHRPAMTGRSRRKLKCLILACSTILKL